LAQKVSSHGDGERAGGTSDTEELHSLLDEGHQAGGLADIEDNLMCRGGLGGSSS
jgi:hypothetical protein